MKTIISFGIVMMTAAATMAQTWLGEYQWVATDKEKAVIEKAVEDGAQQVGLLLRSVARGRLRDSTKPFQKLSFAMNENKTMTMTRDDDTPIVGATDNTKIEWKRKDGKVFKVTQTLEGNTFTQTFTDADDNTRVNKHVFNEEGNRLTLTITLNSSSFKTPVTYALTYERPKK